MSAIRFVLLCTLSVFFFSQLVLSRPEEESKLKSVEAKVSVAFDDLKKALGDVMANINDTWNTQLAQNPSAAEIYKNLTENMSAIAKQLQDAITPVTPKP